MKAGDLFLIGGVVLAVGAGLILLGDSDFAARTRGRFGLGDTEPPKGPGGVGLNIGGRSGITLQVPESTANKGIDLGKQLGLFG